MATRNFATISIEDLIAKIKAVEGDNGTHALLEHLGTDIKVAFDLENVSDSPKDFGPKALMGFHTEANGLTYCGMCAGGDWEHPVFFCVYWDGKKLRGYVPTEGNPWNTTTKAAYGNDETADAKNARKRWPDKFDADTEEVEAGDFEFEPELIRQDILERLLPQGQKAPAKSKVIVAPLPRRPAPRPRGPKVQPVPDDFKIKSIQERIESLTYYGTGDEGYELFQKTCALSYSLFGLGMNGKAEIAAAWAEEMAYESRNWAEQHGSENDTALGHWGY